jgi:hypothetical protein
VADDRKGILQALHTRTQVFGLFLLVVEALFGAAVLTKLQGDSTRFKALLVAAGVLVFFVAALTLIEVTATRAQRTDGQLKSSGLTPYDKIMNDIVKSTLETICRAVSLPQTPESANLRVFIFRKEDNWLVCRYYWAPNPVGEEVGKLKFPLDIGTAKEVAVVRCAVEGKITRTPVGTLTPSPEHHTDEVDPDLRFVLAAPIVAQNGNTWGVVDFDTTSENGEALLSTDISKSAIYQLARHLQVILFAFPPPGEVRSLDSPLPL